MFTSVMPTSSVTSSSCGRSSNGASGCRACPCCSASSLSRARPSEKYAASAPVNSAEQRTSNARPINSSVIWLVMEMLVARAHRHRGAGRVDPGYSGWPARYLADHRERRAGRGTQARGEVLRRAGVAREQQLIVLAAAGGPVDRIDAEDSRRFEN